MKENFEHAMKFIFFWEKHITDDPNDPGGFTIWGITNRDYPQEINLMRSMTAGESKEYAKEIYRRKYWTQTDGDNKQFPLDIVLMNIAVNQGVSVANLIFGKAFDWRDAIILSSDRYDDLKNYKLYGAGWNKRLVSLRDYIISNFNVLEWDRKEMVSGKEVV